MSKLRAVYVEWIDSVSPADSDWHRMEELNLKVLSCQTVGYLVDEDKTQLSVASCVMENGALYGVITIPKVAITRRRRLPIG